MYHAADPSRRGKMSVIPRKIWCPHKARRDSKSQGGSKNTTRSVFSTAGSFGYLRESMLSEAMTRAQSTTVLKMVHVVKATCSEFTAAL